MVMTTPVLPGWGIHTLQNSREIVYDNGNIMCSQQYLLSRCCMHYLIEHNLNLEKNVSGRLLFENGN